MTIEERVKKLELKLTRARFINRLLVVLGIGVFLILWFFTSGTPTAQEKVMDEVRAKKIILVDENGENRAMLSVFEEDTWLELYDEKGNSRVRLFVHKDQTSLNMSDENGNSRAWLGVFKDGTSMTLRDENGKNRAMLIVGKDGPGLSLLDENGNFRAALGAHRIETNDGRIITYPESSLLLFDPDRPMIWKAP